MSAATSTKGRPSISMGPIPGPPPSTAMPCSPDGGSREVGQTRPVGTVRQGCVANRQQGPQSPQSAPAQRPPASVVDWSLTGLNQRQKLCHSQCDSPLAVTRGRDHIADSSRAGDEGRRVLPMANGGTGHSAPAIPSKSTPPLCTPCRSFLQARPGSSMAHGWGGNMA